MVVTASGLGEFAYCNKKWALAREHGKISPDELKKRIETLSRAGQEGSPEFALMTRMLLAQDRLDAGTAAHTAHAKDAAVVGEAQSHSWILIAAAAALAVLALWLFIR